MLDANWKKGRGKLGIFAPLMGTWTCETESELGAVSCTRCFEAVLDRKFVRLEANWLIGQDGRRYDEFCLFGTGGDKQIHFWSFNSDGKRSEGWLSAAPDIHPEALCFEADMDAGRARQVYWPEADGFGWAVESRTKRGWNRFVEHQYRRQETR